MSRRPVAVLFDLGDVLVRVDPARASTRFAQLAEPSRPVREEPAPLEELADRYVARTIDALGRGQLQPGDFFHGLGEALGHSIARPAAEVAWCSMFDPWPEMEALASALADSPHPLYLLSNTDPVHFAYLEPRLPVLAHFDGLHLSYEVGEVKPAPGFFTTALRRFALEPEHCLFIDDREDNVAAARALGIPAHRHDGDVEAVRDVLRQNGAGL